MADASEVSIARALGEFRNRDRMPLMVLALLHDAVVGAAQLKFREMKIYPDKEHWLGGVYVDSRHRGQGIGSALVKESIRLALGCKVELLYLQTQQLDGGMYRRLGWSPVEEVSYHGLQVLVMEKALSAQFG